jgi:hypothetical protein
LSIAVDGRFGNDNGRGSIDDGGAEAGKRVGVQDVEERTADGGVGGDGVAAVALRGMGGSVRDGRRKQKKTARTEGFRGVFPPSTGER